MKLTLTTKEVNFLKKEISRDFHSENIFNTPTLQGVVGKLTENVDYTEDELYHLGEWLSFNIDSYGWESKEGKIIEPILNKVNGLVWG